MSVYELAPDFKKENPILYIHQGEGENSFPESHEKSLTIRERHGDGKKSTTRHIYKIETRNQVEVYTLSSARKNRICVYKK